MPNCIYKISVFCFGLIIPFCVFSQNIWYVNQAMPASSYGNSWATALKTIDEGIINAQAGDEIWVARGTYKPSRNAQGVLLPLYDKECTFTLKFGVSLYGGFFGNENSIDERNNFGYGEINETILSCDFLNNDDYSNYPWTGTLENCYCVLSLYYAQGLDSTTIIDGFSIRGGHNTTSIGNGGGVVNYNNAPHLSNIVISNNYAKYGAGIYNTGDSSNLSIINSEIINNYAEYSGGGVCNYANSCPLYKNVLFEMNKSLQGGAMFNAWDANPRLLSCTLKTNSADLGGGILNDFFASPIIDSCFFIYNSGIHGGGLMNTTGTSPVVRNSIFESNIADFGGGMGNDMANTLIENVSFIRNFCYAFGGGVYDSQSPSIYRNVTFSENHSGSGGGGIFLGHLSKTNLDSIVVVKNFSEADGGGIMIDSESDVVINNAFISENTAVNAGGGISIDFVSKASFKNIYITKNNAYLGGGTNVCWGSNAVFLNTVIADNTAENAAGIGIYYESEVQITNGTIAQNNALNFGGGIENATNSNLNVYNSIIWGNTAQNDGQQILNSASTELFYSCISNTFLDFSPTVVLNNCLHANPKFYDNYNFDYRITSMSPCINAGLNSYNISPLDIRGQARIQNSTIDMGAYEFTPTEDPVQPSAVSKISKSYPYIRFFPNPSSDIINVETSHPTNISILDYSGKIIFTKDISNNFQLNISQWESGIYFIFSNNTTSKFIKY